MLLDRFRLTDRVAVVTGAGRGIGAGIATAFAEVGADVVLVARTASDLEQVAEQVRGFGRRATVVPLDVLAEGAAATIVEAAVAGFGRIDVVVNNAGGTAPRPLLQTTPGYVERAFRFNVLTAYDLTRAAVPHLLETRGSVVNISSAIGRLSDRGFVAYGTAKAALAHMTRMLAEDLAPKVRVNAIAVGSVATAALDTVLTDDLRARMIEGTPLRRLGEPVDIALAALYLASDAGSYVTGKVVEVDGGLTAPNLALGLPDL